MMKLSVRMTRVADPLRRGLSAARFFHTSWRDTGPMECVSYFAERDWPSKLKDWEL